MGFFILMAACLGLASWIDRSTRDGRRPLGALALRLAAAAVLLLAGGVVRAAWSCEDYQRVGEAVAGGAVVAIVCLVMGADAAARRRAGVSGTE